jgi:hypothetical protein
MSWVANEVARCRLKDQRLQQRLAVIVERLGAKPTASIPAACRGWGETQATYRFFSNDRVEAREILDGQSQATVKRIAAESVVLSVQDTTFLEYIKDVMEKGMGTLRETSREEHLLHPSVAFTPARVNLGVLTPQFWQRPEESVGHLRAQRPIEEKASYRWLVGYGVACEVQRCCPETLVVSVADREGDIHEWFLASAERAEEERAAFVIRAKCNRRVAAQPQDTYLWGALRAAPVLGQTTIEVAARAGRAARRADLTVRTQVVTFDRRRRRGGNLPPVQVQAISVTEEVPPPGEEPLEWMLLTDLPVDDFKTARLIIEWYRARRQVEVYQSQPVKMPWSPLRLLVAAIIYLRGLVKREDIGDVDLLPGNDNFFDQTLRDRLAIFERQPLQVIPQQLAKVVNMLDDLLPVERLGAGAS